VYRVAGAPRSLAQTVRAAHLWAGAGSAVSHRSAAVIHGLDGIGPGMVEVTIPRRSRPPAGRVRLHYDRNLPPDEVIRLGRLCVTTAARTVLDLGAVVSPWVVELALEDAIRKGLTTFAELVEMLRRHGRSGRNGAGVLRRILEELDPSQPVTASSFELRLFKLIRERGFPPPVKRYSAYTATGILLGELDFAWPRLKIGIEADSYRFHSGRLAWENNIERRNQFTADGWIVIHVTWRKLFDYPDLVARQIERTFSSRLSRL
jgi:hypothetical protein